MEEFEATYEKKVVPVLRRHDLLESSERARGPVEGIFSRLFEIEMPAQVAVKKRALQKDPGWQELLRSLGTAFGTTQPDGLLRDYFSIHRTPVGPGKVVEAGPGHRQGLWQSFTVRDGLPFPNVHSVVEDGSENLWFGTNQGAVRYDGIDLLTFTAEDGLTDSFVWCMLEDGHRNLWFGTLRGGVSRYDGKEFVTFTTGDGLAGNDVRSIVEDREGNIWFATRWAGVSRYDGEEFVSFTAENGLAGNYMKCILEDDEGNLWFGTGSPPGGVSRYNGREFTTFTTKDGLAHNTVSSILQDREGDLWFGTDSGVSFYDGKKFVSLDKLTGNSVHCILERQGGDLWFGTKTNGIIHYDGERVVAFTTEDGLAADDVSSILEDRRGYIWLGTVGGGVSRYDGVQFTNFDSEDGLARNRVHCVVEDREGNLWFGTEGGVSRYDGREFVNFTAKDGLTGDMVECALEDREGNLWFGSRHRGVSRYDGKEFVNFTTEDGLTYNNMASILGDSKGNIWIGTWRGVSRYDGENFCTIVASDGITYNQVWCILEDRKGNLWFGDAKGLSCYDGEEFVSFTIGDGSAHSPVYSILEDRGGDLWIGTEAYGVSRYDGKRFVTFTTKDGLAGNAVHTIFQDREGYLWFGTIGGGVNIYDGLVFQNLSREDGLVHDSVNQILQDRSGDIWITTDGGVTRYRPQHIPPTAYIKEVITDHRYGSVGEISIPSSQKFIIFEFRGRSFSTRHDGMAYVYKLEGYDTDWRANYTGRVEYQDLPLGTYTFQVKAVDRDLNYSEPATVKVNVEPDPHLEAFAEALSGTSDEFVGDSMALRRVQEQIMEVASTDMTVLISGETGTGKGLAARTIHGLSPRKRGPFIQVNCGAIAEGLAESELFGHERGAFTGAISRKLGKVELAEKGTLFLDEIGDLAMTAQGKLLRILEERTFERVGGTETLKVDVRVIAATNRDLRQMVEKETFREDLYFRLQGFEIELPLLCERREDIPLLANYFMERMASHLDKEITHLTLEALSVLQSYDWPGNVRELEHAIQRAVIVCRGPAIRAEDIALESAPLEGMPNGRVVPLEEYERHYIERVLEQTDWVVKGEHGAAALLGLNASTLRFRIKKLGIRRF